MTTQSLSVSPNITQVTANGGNYLFDGVAYDASTKIELATDSYIFNVPYAHPIAFLDSTNITYSVDDSTPIQINVANGNTSTNAQGDYYDFTDSNGDAISISNNNNNNGYRFMRGRSYVFNVANVSGDHPLRIYVNGSLQTESNQTISITISSSHSLTSGAIYYQCNVHSGMQGNLQLLNRTLTGTTNDGNYDFYYGTVNVTVSGNFNQASYRCYHHGYMGGNNRLQHVDYQEPPPPPTPVINAIATSAFTWGDILSTVETQTDQTVSVTTTDVPNSTTLTLTLTVHHLSLYL